jgi:hypothetical protein
MVMRRAAIATEYPRAIAAVAHTEPDAFKFRGWGDWQQYEQRANASTEAAPKLAITPKLKVFAIICLPPDVMADKGESHHFERWSALSFLPFTGFLKTELLLQEKGNHLEFYGCLQTAR